MSFLGSILDDCGLTVGLIGFLVEDCWFRLTLFYYSGFGSIGGFGLYSSRLGGVWGGALGCLGGGVFGGLGENTTSLLGYDGLCGLS